MGGGELASGSVWHKYNLKSDPYFLQALANEKLDLLRGQSRLSAANEILTHIHSGGSPILLLESGPGVGKTTLVNYVKAHLADSGEFFVYPRTIEISAESTRETVAAEYLCAMTLAAITNDKEFDWAQDARWIQASQYITDVADSGQLGSSFTFAGFGVEFTNTRARQLARVLPWDTWRVLIENIAGAMLDRRQGFVVHLDNIDAVSDNDPGKVRQLFDEIRELLLTPGVTTIIAANPSFRSEVIADRQRILDVLTVLASFRELTPEEFTEVVSARYDYFAEPGKKAIKPITDDGMRRLYELFDGDLRNTFNVARAAVIQAALMRGERTLAFDDVLVLYSQKLSDLFNTLAPSEQRIVRHLLSETSGPSQAEVRRATNDPQPTVSHATRRLMYKRWTRTELRGKRLAYYLAGYGQLLRIAIDKEYVQFEPEATDDGES